MTFSSFMIFYVAAANAWTASSILLTKENGAPRIAMVLGWYLLPWTWPVIIYYWIVKR